VSAFALTVIGATLLLQGLIHLAPGSAADLIPGAPRTGLLAGALAALAGDLGESLTVSPGASVRELTIRAWGASLGLLGPAALLSTVGSLMLAHRPLGRLVTPVSAAPLFLLALAIVTGINEATFALINADVISRPAWFAVPDRPSTLRWLIGVGILAVGSGALSGPQAEWRAALGRVHRSGFVTAARALGLPVGPHVRAALAPFAAQLLARRIAFGVGGLVIAERMLLLRGAGSLLWEACLRRDHPLALGLSLSAAVIVAGARLLADLSEIALDPRRAS